MSESPEPVRRLPPRGERVNYHALNDGSDEEAPVEDRVSKKPRLSLAAPDDSDSSEDDGGEGPTTQLTMANDLQDLPVENVTIDIGDDGVGEEETPKPSQRSVRSPNLWAQFNVLPIPRKFWVRRAGEQEIQDREIKCKQCSWSVKDSKRFFLYDKHEGNHVKLHSHQRDSKQPSITSVVTKQAERRRTTNMEKDLIRFMVVDQMGFTTIESPRLIRLLENQGISLPYKSAGTLGRRIHEDFEILRKKLINDLNDTCTTISLSLDGWTSKNNKAIFGVIGHWITPDFQYKERLLNFAEIKGYHGGENMAGMVQAVLEELGLERKLLAITADNASANGVLVESLYDNLKDRIPKQDLCFEGRGSYMRCIAHVMYLIASKILATLRAGSFQEADSICDRMTSNSQQVEPLSALSRLRVMVLWSHRTPQRQEQWEFVCQSNRLNDRFIEYDVDTRWNSTYRMIKQALESKLQLKRWAEYQKRLEVFSEQDWVYLEKIKDILAPLEEYTLEVPKRAPQISMAVPIYYLLHDHLTEAANKDKKFESLHDDIAAAASRGFEKYLKYYLKMDDLDPFYILIIDPRFKHHLVHKDLEDADDVISHVKKRLTELYLRALPTSDDDEQQPLENLSPQARVQRQMQPKRRHKSDIDKYLSDDVAFADEANNIDGTKPELEDENEWLLTWWRNHGADYPSVAKAARDYLSVPASGVPVERSLFLVPTAPSWSSPLSPLKLSSARPYLGYHLPLGHFQTLRIFPYLLSQFRVLVRRHLHNDRAKG